uniref:F-box domain-containing protein n=1 Tax=Steinernema glaseri TaxID=37863 RepID=A0A1I7Y9E4_9BILA
MAPNPIESSHSPFRPRQLSFPAVESSKALDFRRLFKSNQTMDHGASLIRRCVSTIRKRNPIVYHEELPSQSQAQLPNELLTNVFSRLEGADLRSARAVCRQWNRVIEHTKYVLETLTPRTVSRFVVQSSRGALELRWCVYGRGESRSLLLTPQQLRSGLSLEFAFRHFEIQRIIFKNVSLTEELLSFLRRHFEVSPRFAPLSFVLESVDVSALSPAAFERFFAFVAPSLETFQLRSLSGLRADTVTDSLMRHLDAQKVRSIEISAPRFVFAHRPKLLRVSDLTLARLSCGGNFPALHLERCQITSLMLAHYTENYLKKAAQDARRIQSQVCTIKKCPAVSNQGYENECRRRSLSCEEDDKKRNLYSVHTEEHAEAAFTISLIDDEPRSDVLVQ